MLEKLQEKNEKMNEDQPPLLVNNPICRTSMAVSKIPLEVIFNDEVDQIK